MLIWTCVVRELHKGPFRALSIISFKQAFFDSNRLLNVEKAKSCFRGNSLGFIMISAIWIQVDEDRPVKATVDYFIPCLSCVLGMKVKRLDFKLSRLSLCHPFEVVLPFYEDTDSWTRHFNRLLIWQRTIFSLTFWKIVCRLSSIFSNISQYLLKFHPIC